ncbi:hypothetical protein [Fibrella aestuarina]|uniref:hypothetical protein n=1 Tax=Fibrella aestuarina TaxID=651143 RepID=UPI0008141518|nr:hypothetical protein [Fibrella aestuarina]
MKAFPIGKAFLLAQLAVAGHRPATKVCDGSELLTLTFMAAKVHIFLNSMHAYYFCYICAYSELTFVITEKT